MANFQSFVWWQRFFEIHTHDHHTDGLWLWLSRNNQQERMAMTKNACLPWLLQKTSLLRLTKNEQLVIFNIELTHSTENMSNDNVAWFSRFISPLRQKRVDMPWPLLAKSDALHFLQSLWCIAKNAQYSREKFSLESLLRIVSPQCIEISADSPIHKAEWPLFLHLNVCNVPLFVDMLQNPKLNHR